MIFCAMVDQPDRQDDWHIAARELYRQAQTELLERWAAPSPEWLVEFYKEELREALLDLKQAVIEGRPVAALTAADEIAVCLSELRSRTGGDL
jgi:hypothetical protein